MRSVPAGRPLPDAADLRLLSELARSSGSIGLPQAAWQAGMTQSEAAGRLVAMAAAGLPLRLVVEGDAARLWQTVQQGPARPAEAANPGYRIVPPPEVPASSTSVWGIPGTASWTDRPRPGSNADPAADPAADTAVAGASVRIGTPQSTTGLSGEQVTVTAAAVIDPGNELLTAAGYRLEPTERAILVRTTLSNAGPADHDTMPDLYLFLVDAAGATLAQAPVSVAGYFAHRVGVAPGATADGWTIFLIEATVTVTAVRWCVRPDLVDRTLSWSI